MKELRDLKDLASYSTKVGRILVCSEMKSMRLSHKQLMRPAGVPRSYETAQLPRTTIGPYAEPYCRVLGRRCFL